MSFVEDFHESPHYNYHHTSFIMFTPFATFKCVTVRILEPPNETNASTRYNAIQISIWLFCVLK